MEVAQPTASICRSLKYWKYLGLWPEGSNKTIYKYYSYTFLFVVLILYNIQQTVSLVYTPKKVELMIKEITFFFNVAAITINAFNVLYRKESIIKVLKALNDEQFEGKDDISNEIIRKDIAHYELYWKGLLCLGNFVIAMKGVVPVIANLFFDSYHISLPTFNYYFLDEKTKNDYFVWLFAYEFLAIYTAMLYDVSCDTFINGILFYAITQMKILQHKLRTLNVPTLNKKLSKDAQETVYMMKLKECLIHYDCILKYCSDVQSLTSISMFVKYGLNCAIICVLLCGLLLPSTMDAIVFMVFYLVGMVLQIFLPSWLGSQLSNQSQELVFAAYNSDWIARTEPFKRSIKVFMERAKTPIVMVGFKLFPLSLETFTSIMKTTYSFVALVRNFQDREENNI